MQIALNRDAFPHRKDGYKCVTRNSSDTRCHGASRLHDPFNAGHAPEACRSEVSFDAAGCGSEIAMRRLLASERMLDGGVGAG